MPAFALHPLPRTRFGDRPTGKIRSISSRFQSRQCEKSLARKQKIIEPHQADLGRPVPSQKIFRFAATPNQIYIHGRPASSEGRIAIVTDVECGMRWTRQCADVRSLLADGEVVWFWRSEAGAKVAG
jgi:hypothetical protein